MNSTTQMYVLVYYIMMSFRPLVLSLSLSLSIYLSLTLSLTLSLSLSLSLSPSLFPSLSLLHTTYKSHTNAHAHTCTCTIPTLTSQCKVFSMPISFCTTSPAKFNFVYNNINGSLSSLGRSGGPQMDNPVPTDGNVGGARGEMSPSGNEPLLVSVTLMHQG